MPERLLIDEPQALAHCGAGVERGLESFFGVGEAMATIREKLLYRADYKTFEEYGRDRRGMSRIPVHRCMESAHVVAHLLPIGNIPGKEEARQRRMERRGKKMNSMPIPEDQPQRTTCPSKRNGWAACIRSKVKPWGRTVIRRSTMMKVWRGWAEKYALEGLDLPGKGGIILVKLLVKGGKSIERMEIGIIEGGGGCKAGYLRNFFCCCRR
jgi:hypothetical protein